MTEKHLDRRRKYYVVLDCETATLPYAHNFDGNARKQIAISKPLIYDLGWKIIDSKGNTYRRKSYLITEIFSVPAIFNTAHYASKRPLYLEKLKRGEIVLTSWEQASADLVKDMAEAEAVGAYNSMFDFKKALPFTEKYIEMLYSPNFYEWEERQNKICDYIVSHRSESTNEFDPDTFTFRGKTYPLFDIWGLSCEHLLNNDDYKDTCYCNGWTTASGKYYTTSAEKAYAFVSGNHDFEESHTAIEDADIEGFLLAQVFKKVKPKDMTMGIIYFPFRILGRADI